MSGKTKAIGLGASRADPMTTTPFPAPSQDGSGRTGSRSRNIRSALVTLVFVVPSVAGAEQPAEISDPVTRYAIAQFLIQSSANSVEDFVAGLPANHRREFELSVETSIHRYRDASTTVPWAVAKGTDSRFVFGWGTDPSRSGYDLVYWTSRMGNHVRTGLIDFAGTSPRFSHSLGCLRCHARTSEDGTTTAVVSRTIPADDSTRDTLLQTLSEDRRIGVLAVAPLQPILQADWQPLDGIDWTNQWRGEEGARFELSVDNAVDVRQFISKRMSDLEARTGSNQIEEVEFAIARLGSHPTWFVATDQSAPWTLAGAGFSRGISALQQTGQYWMQVRAFTTDEEGQRIASIPLDIAYKVENGDLPTDFRRSSALRRTGNFGSSSSSSSCDPRTTTLVVDEHGLQYLPDSDRLNALDPSIRRNTVTYAWDCDLSGNENLDGLTQAVRDATPAPDEPADNP